MIFHRALNIPRLCIIRSVVLGLKSPINNVNSRWTSSNVKSFVDNSNISRASRAALCIVISYVSASDSEEVITEETGAEGKEEEAGEVSDGVGITAGVSNSFVVFRYNYS